MTTTRTKRTYRGRNTGLFFGYLKQLPGYTATERETIAGGVVDSYLTGKLGSEHGRAVSLRALSDEEYAELLADLRHQVNASTDAATLKDRANEQAVRRGLYHRIFARLSSIGVTTTHGYTEANRHIVGLPISRGRILPAIPTDELPALYKAVCAYCDNILRKQQKEREAAQSN